MIENKCMFDKMNDNKIIIIFTFFIFSELKVKF